jgi:hypothetical protein
MPARKRCPNGTRKSLKKADAGKCVPVTEKKRCSNGYHRNKKTGNCEKTHPSASHLEHSTRPKSTRPKHSLTRRTSTRRRSNSLSPPSRGPKEEEYEDIIRKRMEDDDANLDYYGNYLQPISESEIKEEIKRIRTYNKNHPKSPIDKYEVYDELMSKSKSKRAWSSPKKTPRRGWLW